MRPKNENQQSLDLEDAEDAQTLPLGDVLKHADEIAEHEELDEELGI